MQVNSEYVPGTCNIGPVEIKRRKVATVFSFVLTIIIILLLLFFHANRFWRLILFVPVSALAVNAEQLYFKFCVNFGLRGVFNFGDPGKLDTVEQREFRMADRKKAISMILSGMLIGAIAAILFFLLDF